MVSNLYILNTTVKQSECEKFGNLKKVIRQTYIYSIQYALTYKLKKRFSNYLDNPTATSEVELQLTKNIPWKKENNKRNPTHNLMLLF